MRLYTKCIIFIYTKNIILIISYYLVACQMIQQSANLLLLILKDTRQINSTQKERQQK